MWLGVPLQNSAYATGMLVYVTLPDGTSTTLGPFISDETGGAHTTYTPTQTGTYTFYMSYPGQTLQPVIALIGTGGSYVGDFEEPGKSPTVTLTVTSTPASQYIFTPLPTSYWQTPVNAENVQNWYAITGPWLGLSTQAFTTTGGYNGTISNDVGDGNYNPYTTAPTTGHILWTTPWCEGGVAGGYSGGGPSSGTEEGDYWVTSQYEPKWAPVVINGIMYSAWYTGTTSESNGIRALNLYNGQQLWTINTQNPLVCGMVTYFETINEYGYIGPYIWTTGPLPASVTGGTAYPAEAGTTQWNMYDGLTGNYICSIVNGTGDSVGNDALTTDANGNLILYYINDTAGTQIIYPNQNNGVFSLIFGLPYSATPMTTTGDSIGMFNFTQALQSNMQLAVTSGIADWLWEPPLDTQYLWNLGIMNEVNIPSAMASIPLFGIGGIASNSLVLTANGGLTGEFFGGETPGWLYTESFSLTNLALMWSDNITETPFTRLAQAFGDGYMVDMNCETNVLNGYSLQTGDLVWTNTLTGYNGGPTDAFDSYDIFGVVGNGVIWVYGFGGDMWALNLNTGTVLWYTNTTALFGSPGLETPYGTWPLWIFGNVVTNGQLIMYSEGHEYDPPLFHGAQLFALNCTTGKLVWSVLGFDTTGAELSYGIELGLNSYDGQLYAYGQGPSKTTVTAPNPVGTVGSPMVISGTVMDVSAGTSQEAVAADFPNGLPCISDADQGQWMAAVYEQQPIPADLTGVPITLTAVDPNGNLITLGTTTSTASGAWGMTWTPPSVPGNYTITATFAGTGAYYGSYAQTFVYVGSAPTPAPPTATPVSQATTQSYVLGLGIAAIIVIIIIGAILAMLMLRKKP